ncbi:MAG: ABC transporter substrate-binding protein [Clostridia bacterium]|nr:ABC transporter substrate-binding protein [Clostridia bacterium]
MKKALRRISILLSLMLVLTSLAGAAFAEGETYNIGIIQLIQHPALDAATQGFIDALTEKLGEDKLNFDSQNASGDSANCATIVNGFVSANVDLIMANATAALQAAYNGTETIPILGTSISTYVAALDIEVNEDGSTGLNVSGTSDLAPLDGQAEVLHELLPDAKTVGLLYCSAEPNSKYQIDVIEPYIQAYGYETTRYTFSDSNDLASIVTKAVSEVDVIYVPTDNTVANNTEVVNNIALPAGIPVIAGEEGICAGCGVATLSINYYDIGYVTGEMAYEILVNGADVSAMPIAYAPEVTKKYNAENAAALNIEIPEGYEAIE